MKKVKEYVNGGMVVTALGVVAGMFVAAKFIEPHLGKITGGKK